MDGMTINHIVSIDHGSYIYIYIYWFTVPLNYRYTVSYIYHGWDRVTLIFPKKLGNGESSKFYLCETGENHLQMSDFHWFSIAMFEYCTGYLCELMQHDGTI